MNITQENLKDQTAILKVTVQEADYSEKVEKALKNYRKKANVPGFRPGMVPVGLINKMYRKGTIAEETYRAATDAAFEYIKENKIDLIGDLMPADSQGELDFENDKDFEFVFLVGLAPEVKLDLAKKEDTITKYIVTPNEEMISSYRDNFLKRYGKLVDVDVVEKDEAVDVTLKNDDMTIENAYIGLISMNDDERAPFIGKKVGDTMNVNINDLYKDPRQRAAMLGIKENELEGLNPEFAIEITKIRQFRNPDLNEEFFALAFPDGMVKDEAAFDAEILKQVEAELASQTEFKDTDQVRQYLIEKTNLSLPESFLKNWLFEINEGKYSMEDIEKDFPAFLDMMRWDLIKRNIAQTQNVEITEEDAVNEAKSMAAMQFRYYGMNQVGEEMLDNYAKQILSNKEEANKIFERVGERKIVDKVMSLVTIKKKKVSLDEFSAMMQAK